jgi:hypothetical protein
MSLSKRLDRNPARMRVLASGNETSVELRQQVCQRCGKVWWPRTPNRPARCPGCKSPYWDQPRRLTVAIKPLKEGATAETVANRLRREEAMSSRRKTENSAAALQRPEERQGSVQPGDVVGIGEAGAERRPALRERFQTVFRKGHALAQMCARPHPVGALCS